MNVPCLIFNSINDPIIPAKIVPIAELALNQNIIHIMVNGGGHVEYLSGWRGKDNWAIKTAIQFFKTVYEMKRNNSYVGTTLINPIEPESIKDFDFCKITRKESEITAV